MREFPNSGPSAFFGGGIGSETSRPILDIKEEDKEEDEEEKKEVSNFQSEERKSVFDIDS
jgi:hypothetical protein